MKTRQRKRKEVEVGEVRRGGKRRDGDQKGDLHQHHPDYSIKAHFEHRGFQMLSYRWQGSRGRVDAS